MKPPDAAAAAPAQAKDQPEPPERSREPFWAGE
jgi:hypothetical protein